MNSELRRQALGGWCIWNTARRNFVRQLSHSKCCFGNLPREYIQAEPSIDDEIVVAMSSGVDSSVCAALYAQKFPKVRGVYMANWTQSAKCLESDWKDVQRVCSQVGIPCERLNFEKEYWHDVFQPMIQGYEKGLTPNPDLQCNRHIKFGLLVEYMRRKFGDLHNWWLVTGHYARIMMHKPSGEYHLLRGYSNQKDQAYYLANVSSSIFPKILMPIGHMEKPDVRKIAEKYNLTTAKKPDSQGLCFVSQENRHFRDFLNEFIPPNPGNIITEDGTVWGRHQGLWHGTIGQRLGISMPQGDHKYKGVWFVSEKRLSSNEIVIVKGSNNEKLFQNCLKVMRWHWINGEPNELKILLASQQITLQYRSLQEPALVKALKSLSDDTCHIELNEKVKAMAPGQNIVLYRGERILGAGILAKTYNYM